MLIWTGAKMISTPHGREGILCMRADIDIMAKMKSESSVVVRPMTTPENGFNCCGVCRVCTCIRWSFLSTPTGVVKTAQTIFSFICQILSLHFGVKYAQELGMTFLIFLNASAASFMISIMLLMCYVSSPITFQRIRPTYYEIFSNLILSLLFILSGSSLVYTVHKELFFYFNTIPGFHAYPAMTANYMFGFMLAILHAVDAVMSFRAMRSITRA